jgi:hypothetical protein
LTEEVSLRDHLESMMEERDKRYDQRFEDSKEAISAALAASKEAVVKAELATEKRFDAVNEFRGALSDAQSRYITKSEAIALITVISVVVGAIVAVVNFAVQHFR